MARKTLLLGLGLAMAALLLWKAAMFQNASPRRSEASGAQATAKDVETARAEEITGKVTGLTNDPPAAPLSLPPPPPPPPPRPQPQPLLPKAPAPSCSKSALPVFGSALLAVANDTVCPALLKGVATGNGKEVQVHTASSPPACLAALPEPAQHVLFWDCASPFTRFEHNAATGELRRGGNCVRVGESGALMLGPCDGKGWSLSLTEHSVFVFGNTHIAVSLAPSGMFDAAIGWFRQLRGQPASAKVSGEIEHSLGAILLNPFVDGLAVRATLKGLAQLSDMHLFPTAVPCDQLTTNTKPTPLTSRRVPVTATQTGFAAALSWVPLSSTSPPPRSMVLAHGGVSTADSHSLLACAPLQSVPRSQVSFALTFDDSLYGTSARPFQQRNSPDANMFPTLSATDADDVLVQMKFDATAWLPELPSAVARAGTTKIILSAVCKNNAAAIHIMSKSMEKVGSLFQDYRIVMYENDSNDNTASLLQGWARLNPKVRAVTESAPGPGPRERRIEAARNRLLNIVSAAEYNDFEYLLQVDCDFPTGLPALSVVSSFTRTDWDVACGYGIAGTAPHKYLWDRYAYRDARWPKLSWPWIRDMRPLLSFDPGEAWVPAHSCFGGFALYRRAAIGKCYYNATDLSIVENFELHVDCEHVSFSQCIRAAGGRLFTNPAGLIRYYVTNYGLYG